MENKKYIGSAFRDKLDALDKTPSDRAWQSISKDLDKKKKRRFVIFFLFGMALVLFMLLFIPGARNTSSPERNPERDTVSGNAVAIKPGNNTTQTLNDTMFKNRTARKTKTTITKKLIRATDELEEYEVVTRYKVYVKKSKSAVVTSKTISAEGPKDVGKKSAKDKVKTIVPNAKHSKNLTADRKNTSKKLKIRIHSKKGKKPFTGKKSVKGKGPADSNPGTMVSDKSATETVFPIESKPENVAAAIDSVKIEPKTDDTITKEKKKKIPKKYTERTPQDPEKLDKLFFSAFIGPLFYNSLSKSSPVIKGGDFEKNGSVNLNYSIYLRGMYTDKFGLRLGIAKTNTQYTTTVANDGSTPWILGVTNIRFNNAFNHEVLNNYFAGSGKVDLVQKVDYLEIPVEAYLVFQENTIGIDGFAGFSTYFLTKNELLAKSSNQNAVEIGEVRDLKNTAFSLNLGCVLNYPLGEKLLANLSPWLKYQFKPAGNDFSPILFAVQAGLTYKL